MRSTYYIGPIISTLSVVCCATPGPTSGGGKSETTTASDLVASWDEPSSDSRRLRCFAQGLQSVRFTSNPSADPPHLKLTVQHETQPGHYQAWRLFLPASHYCKQDDEGGSRYFFADEALAPVAAWYTTPPVAKGPPLAALRPVADEDHRVAFAAPEETNADHDTQIEKACAHRRAHNPRVHSNHCAFWSQDSTSNVVAYSYSERENAFRVVAVGEDRLLRAFTVADCSPRPRTLTNLTEAQKDFSDTQACAGISEYFAAASTTGE